MKLLFKILFLLLVVSSLEAQSLVYFDLNDLVAVKEEYKINRKYLNEINSLAKIASMKEDEFPFSITKFVSPQGVEELNDYYSDSPYWWPVEGDSTLPFIRHDGVTNPNRFMKHKEELQSFYKAVVSLSFLSYFLDSEQYATTANKLLKAWFVDDSTKMNPNLKYAQMIRNRTRKRGVGIIEGRRFAQMTDAINLLKLSNKIDDKLYNEIREWYKNYYNWLTKSFYGIDEKERGNNHSTWWGMQVATIANFLEYEDDIKKLGDYSKHFLLDNQFNSNARQPLEEARTKSLSYSFFNVRAHSFFNAALMNYKIDNWNYVNKNGVKLTDAIDYLLPYLEKPKSWKLKQIINLDSSSPLFLAVSGLKLENTNYLEIYNRLSKYDQKKINKDSFDPIQIIFNIVIKNKLRENGKSN